jgi:hypothetical protein
MAEIVIPMEDLADPMDIPFVFKATNIDDVPVWVRSDLSVAPAGWAGAAEDHGQLAVGVDDYFVNDNYTRTKPAHLTAENVTLRVRYYSDAGYLNLLRTETEVFAFDYVDFNDVGLTVVDDDTFETGVEGWVATSEVGGESAIRSTDYARTGVASLRCFNSETKGVGYASKSFTIGAVTHAFIRVWARFSDSKSIHELWTDAGGGSERIAYIPCSSAPLGGAEFCDQWVVFGLRLPVNGTYSVRLRRKRQGGAGANYFDDIRVVQV